MAHGDVRRHGTENENCEQPASITEANETSGEPAALSDVSSSTRHSPIPAAVPHIASSTRHSPTRTPTRRYAPGPSNSPFSPSDGHVQQEQPEQGYSRFGRKLKSNQMLPKNFFANLMRRTGKAQPKTRFTRRKLLCELRNLGIPPESFKKNLNDREFSKEASQMINAVKCCAQNDILGALEPIPSAEELCEMGASEVDHVLQYQRYCHEKKRRFQTSRESSQELPVSSEQADFYDRLYHELLAIRRFEIIDSSYCVRNCSMCLRTWITNPFATENPYGENLVGPSDPGDWSCVPWWTCSCKRICRGVIYSYVSQQDSSRSVRLHREKPAGSHQQLRQHNFCRECINYIQKSKAESPFSVPSGFYHADVPKELKGLTFAEEQLISPINVFMNCMSLRNGMRKLKGHVACVEQNVQHIATVLPWLPTEASIVIYKRARNRKGDVHMLRVRRYRVQKALEWLCKFNPAFRKIKMSQARIEILPEDGIPKFCEVHVEDTNKVDQNHATDSDSNEKKDLSEEADADTSDEEDDDGMEDIGPAPAQCAPDSYERDASSHSQSIRIVGSIQETIPSTEVSSVLGSAFLQQQKSTTNHLSHGPEAETKYSDAEVRGTSGAAEAADGSGRVGRDTDVAGGGVDGADRVRLNVNDVSSCAVRADARAREIKSADLTSADATGQLGAARACAAGAVGDSSLKEDYVNNAHLPSVEPERGKSFVNLSATPYFLAGAFPTLFVPDTRKPLAAEEDDTPGATPCEVPDDWLIHSTRGGTFSFGKFVAMLYRAPDARFANHGIFKFFCANQKQRLTALQQVSFFVKQELDAPVHSAQTIEGIRKNVERTGAEATVGKINSRIANLPGTSAFYAMKKRELDSIVDYLANKHGDLPCFFVSGSCAEYHNRAFHELLQRYMRATGQLADSEYLFILNEEGQPTYAGGFGLHAAILANTHLLNTWFVTRTRLFFNICFGKGNFEVSNFWYKFEFAPSRGMIHFHGLLWSRHREQLQSFLAPAFDVVTVKGIESLDKKAAQKIGDYLGSHLFISGMHPGGLCAKDFWGKRAEQDNDSTTDEETEYFRAQREQEGGPGFPSMEIPPKAAGNPLAWLAPEGLRPARLNRDQLKTRACQVPRKKVRLDLVEIANITHMHSCNGYCLKKKFGKKRGPPLVECRFGFGPHSRVEPSSMHIIWTKKKCSRIRLAHDHPRMVHTSTPLLSGWRANYDVQPILSTDHKVYKSVQETASERKLNLKQTFQLLKLRASRSYLSSDRTLGMLKRYVSTYACKGELSEEQTREGFRKVLQDLRREDEACNEAQDAEGDDGTKAEVRSSPSHIRKLYVRYTMDLLRHHTVCGAYADFICLSLPLIIMSMRIKQIWLNGDRMLRNQQDDYRQDRGPVEGEADEQPTRLNHWDRFVKHQMGEAQSNRQKSFFEFYDSDERIPVIRGGTMHANSWPVTDGYKKTMLLLHRRGVCNVTDAFAPFPNPGTGKVPNGATSALMKCPKTGALIYDDKALDAVFEDFRTRPECPPYVRQKLESLKFEADLRAQRKNRARSSSLSSTLSSQSSDSSDSHGSESERVPGYIPYAPEYLDDKEIDEGRATPNSGDNNLFPREDGGEVNSSIVGRLSQEEENLQYEPSPAEDFSSDHDWSTFKLDGDIFTISHIKSRWDEVTSAFAVAQTEGFRLDYVDLTLAANFPGQRSVLCMVLEHFKALLDRPAGSPPPRPRRIVIQGVAGTGKSYTLRAISFLCTALFSSNQACVIGAPTGTAAFNASASTNHSLFNLRNSKPLSADKLLQTQAQFKGLKCYICDEVSMVGSSTLARLAMRLDEACSVANQDAIKTYDLDCSTGCGGVPIVILSGDAGQLRPVRDGTLFAKNAKTEAGEIGLRVYAALRQEVVILRIPVRQSGPDQLPYINALTRLRNGKLSSDDINLFNSRRFKFFSGEEKQSFDIRDERIVMRAYPFKQLVHDYNVAYFNGLSRRLVVQQVAKGSVAMAFKSERLGAAAAIPLELPLAVGSVVGLTCNLFSSASTSWGPRNGLYNGSLARVRAILFNNARGPFASPQVGDERNRPMLVLLDSPSYSGPAVFPSHPKIVPLFVQRIFCDKSQDYREGFPLSVEAARTIHRLQGVTVGPNEPIKGLAVLILPKAEQRLVNVAYVALSRNKRIQDLAVLGDGFSNQCRNVYGTSKSAEEQRQHILRLEAIASRQEKTRRENCSKERFAILLDWFVQRMRVSDEERVRVLASSVANDVARFRASTQFNAPDPALVEPSVPSRPKRPAPSRPKRPAPVSASIARSGTKSRQMCKPQLTFKQPPKKRGRPVQKQGRKISPSRSSLRRNTLIVARPCPSHSSKRKRPDLLEDLRSGSRPESIVQSPLDNSIRSWANERRSLLLQHSRELPDPDLRVPIIDDSRAFFDSASPNRLRYIQDFIPYYVAGLMTGTCYESLLPAGTHFDPQLEASVIRAYVYYLRQLVSDQSFRVAVRTPEFVNDRSRNEALRDLFWEHYNRVVYVAHINNNHWVTIQVDKPLKRCVVYDSMLTNDHQTLQRGLASPYFRGIRGQANCFRWLGVDDSWIFNFDRTTPQQADSSSCGIFACMMLAAVTFDRTSFPFPSVTDFREHMVRAIFSLVLRHGASQDNRILTRHRAQTCLVSLHLEPLPFGPLPSAAAAPIRTRRSARLKSKNKK